MSGHDDEIDRLKASVSCAVVLERLPPVWRLDAAESTRRSLKFRRGAGEIVIVNHDGRGWWDPLSPAKGDIFTLVRYLDPSLDFPASRRVLRGLVGLAPTWPERTKHPDLTVKRTKPERYAAWRVSSRVARSGLNPTLFSDAPCWLPQT